MHVHKRSELKPAPVGHTLTASSCMLETKMVTFSPCSNIDTIIDYCTAGNSYLVPRFARGSVAWPVCCAPRSQMHHNVCAHGPTVLTNPERSENR